MDANTIGFAIALPAFIIFAIGLAITVHRLPGGPSSAEILLLALRRLKNSFFWLAVVPRRGRGAQC